MKTVALAVVGSILFGFIVFAIAGAWERHLEQSEPNELSGHYMCGDEMIQLDANMHFRRLWEPDSRVLEEGDWSVEGNDLRLASDEGRSRSAEVVYANNHPILVLEGHEFVMLRPFECFKDR